MTSILVPLDGSALAERALPFARLLAPLLGAGLHLLRVVPDDESEWAAADDPAAWVEVGGARASRWERAAVYLDQQSVSLRSSGLPVAVDVRVGAPAAAIVSVAARHQTALITMATHGYGRLKRWALGSVADAVVHTAATPILLVRGTTPPPSPPDRLRRVLVPLDDSELAWQALPPAAALAAAAQAELIVMQAVAPSIEEYLGATPPLAALRTALHDRAARVCGHRAGTHLAITAVVTLGRAAEAIVEEADRRHADLIMMATRAYSGLKRWTHGSVADRVLHATTVPLVLVRAQDNGDEI
jgi:nucleotide-binding universal stress UspA family protein